MMYPVKHITSKGDAKKLILESCQKIAETVGSTMGYRGRTVLNETEGYLPFPTKDGYHTLKQIFFENAVQHLACQMIKEAAQKSVDESGDGTTLTTVLTNAFIKHAQKEVDNGASPIDVKNAIDKSKELIIAELQEYSRHLTDETIFDVAKTSANHDLDVAKIVAEAYIKAGENGSVSHVRNNTDETVLVNIPGSLIEQGYSNECYINILAERSVFYDNNPLVLVSNISFKTIQQLVPFLEYCNANQRPLILISDLDFTVESIIERNRIENKMPVAVIKPPFNGQKRRDLLKDIATLCNTQVIQLESGSYFKDNFMEYLGMCEDITITKRDTIITPMESQKPVIESKIAELKEQLLSTDINLEKSYIKERISRLSGGVSIIKVGGYTESERKELIDRVDDAVCAVRSAKEGGIVAGGGCALFHISENKKGELDAVTYKAIREPLAQILSNASVENENVLAGFNYPYGYDVKDFEVVNMFEKGIVDARKVIVSALTNSISTATTLLMADHVITYAREDKTFNQ